MKRKKLSARIISPLKSLYRTLRFANRAEEADFLRESGLFNAAYYFSQYPDIAHSGMDSIAHYLLHGASEGRNPHPLFDTKWYVRAYPQVAESGRNPLTHFLLEGAENGLDPFPLFQTAFYLSQEGVGRDARENPLIHFLRIGSSQGLCPHPLFHTPWYLDTYPDAASSEHNPLVHYMLLGAPAGYKPHPLFDPDWYQHLHPQTPREKEKLLLHYIETGSRELLDPHPLFRISAYLKAHPDAGSDGIGAFIHWMSSEESESLTVLKSLGNRFSMVGGLRSMDAYAAWIAENDSFDETDREALRQALSILERKPKISILMPTFEPNSDHLRQAIESVRKQVYENWELCVVDDASPSGEVADIVLEYARVDDRIRFLGRVENGHISRASNDALAMATGEYVALLDHDDLLRPHSLAMHVVELNRHSQARFLYSDEDYLNEKGQRCSPYFKPDWNRELLHAYNYVCHFSLFERALLEEIGGFHVGTEGAQDWDLILRATEKLKAEQICHVPHILYHWRVGDTSCAMNPENKYYSNRAGWKAMQGVVERGTVKGRVRPGPWVVSFCVEHKPEVWPRVTLIVYSAIKSESMEHALRRALQHGLYESLDVLVVGEREPSWTNRFPASLTPNIRFVSYKGTIYESLNHAAMEAQGEVLIFLDRCFHPSHGEWIEELVSQAMRPDVGVVGAKAFYPDGTVQHAGFVLGMQGLLGSVFQGLSPKDHGYVGRAMLRQEMSAVSGCCMAVQKNLFLQDGGFDTKLFRAHFGDADFCLRLADKGFCTIWTPFARGVMHRFGSLRDERQALRSEEDASLIEMASFRRRWEARLLSDPAYNPNLSLETTDCDFASPTRVPYFWRKKKSHRGEVVPAEVAGKDPLTSSPGLAKDRIRTIAFYLPQFHLIPENDAWWGKGFTEWTNVSKATPLFGGHYQPRLPSELGFYDLRLSEVREKQAELARGAGLHAFCYYHYWFSGRRLLQRPFQEVLQSGRPDFPFCLAWANENWTRRWDGGEDDVLVAQEYSLDNARKLMRDLQDVFSDARYVRVDGRPLFLVYRPSLIPDVQAVTDVWREECQASGNGEPYLCTVQSCWNFDDPRPLGFDAAVEFPPHLPLRPVSLDALHPREEPFSACVYDYRKLLHDTLLRPEPTYKLFRGVMPSWDNSPRRKDKPVIVQNLKPGDFGYWLEHACQWTMAHHIGEERLLFINAWNEWGEGCYLEPDQRFGGAFLDQVRRVLTIVSDSANPVL